MLTVSTIVFSFSCQNFYSSMFFLFTLQMTLAIYCKISSSFHSDIILRSIIIHKALLNSLYIRPTHLGRSKLICATRNNRNGYKIQITLAYNNYHKLGRLCHLVQLT